MIPLNPNVQIKLIYCDVIVYLDTKPLFSIITVF